MPVLTHRKTKPQYDIVVAGSGAGGGNFRPRSRDGLGVDWPMSCKQLGCIGNVSMTGTFPSVPDGIIKRLGLESVA